MIRLRVADVSHIDAIVRLLNEDLAQGEAQHSTVKQHVDRANYIVALRGSDVVGIICGRRVSQEFLQRVFAPKYGVKLEDRSHYMITDLYVVPEQRRRGIGTALLDRVMKYRGLPFMAFSYHRLTGWDAEGIFSSRKFINVGELRNFYVESCSAFCTGYSSQCTCKAFLYINNEYK